MNPTAVRLRRVFADVITGLLATSAAVACGGSSESATSGGGGLGPVTSACTGKSFLQGIHVTPAVDGVTQRTEAAFKTLTSSPGVSNVDDGDDGWTASDGELVGTLCATATDQATCKDKATNFRVLPATRAECMADYGGTNVNGLSCIESYLLFTRGDVVGAARSYDEIRAFIAPIDTIDEALYTVTSSGNYEVSCSNDGRNLPASTYQTTADGGFDIDTYVSSCGQPDTTYAVTVHVDVNGTVTEKSRTDLKVEPSCIVGGRRPEGLCAAPVAAGVGAHFAAMATLEAASVVAFRRLHRQLAQVGAPRELLDRVRTAVRDEIRHTRATTALARKYGANPGKPRIASAEAAPTLLDVALENAREGCIRETYGALVARLQVVRAADPDVRAQMAAIADEETEHAALSWDIGAWIEAQLGSEDRARLARERQDAFDALAGDIAAAPSTAETRRLAGIPDRAEAASLLRGLAPLMLAA